MEKTRKQENTFLQNIDNLLKASFAKDKAQNTFANNVLIPVLMFIKDFIKDSFSIQAAGLAYNSLLAIIPTLAVIFAISEGFNISDILKQELYYAFPGQEDFLNKAFVFVNSYLDESRNGLFLGIGVVFLLWTVISLIRNIEATFNRIYDIRESRSVAKQITHYLAMVVLIPVFIVLSSGLSVFIVSYVDNSILSNYLSPMVKGFSKLSSFGFILLSFLFVYKVIPNKEIKFWDVLIPAILASIFFQLFQLIYISGQIWVGKYNAIYGSFAAIPLLLLWLQVSWTICIYGAKLAYNIETSRTFRLEEDKEIISLLDKEFLTFLIMHLIKNDFKNRKFTKVETLSQQIGLTQKLIQEILDDLQQSGLINRVISGKKRGYQPAFDPCDMTYSKIVECVHSTELHPSIEKLTSKYPFILQFINEKQLWIKGYKEEV